MRKSLLAITLAAAAACGQGNAPDAAKPATNGVTPSAANGGDALVQIVPTDPCAWISQAAAEKALGSSLVSAPTRVRSAETPERAPNGAACRYDLPPTGAFPRMIAIEITPDESGVIQAAFTGMGNVESEFKGTEGEGGGLIAGRWDFMSAIPGGLTALKKGRISVLVFAPTGMDAQGMALAAAIVDAIPDVPFTLGPDDPAAVPQAQAASPCGAFGRDVVDAVLDPLLRAPYRSRKGTALVHGAGPSCAYFTGKHRALVTTITYRLGQEIFPMLVGANRIVAGQLGGRTAIDTFPGDWHVQVGTGTDGTFYMLKRTDILSIQFKSSGATYDDALTLAVDWANRFR